jgi:hypothetical protein
MAKTPEKDERDLNKRDEPKQRTAEPTTTQAPPSDPLQPYPTGNPFYPPTEGVPHNSPPPDEETPPASRAHAQEKKS